MDWAVYRERYDVFATSLGASGILARVGSAVLKDFPDNLPSDLRDTVRESVTQVLLSARQVRASDDMATNGAGGATDAEELQVRRSSDSDQQSGLVESSLLVALGEAGISGGFEWDSFARAQHVVMVYAHFDAFFSDSVRAVCEIRPDVLRRDRKISWRDILEQGGWDDLLQRLIEDYVFELGHRGIVERLQAFDRQLSLKLGIPEPDLEAIQYGELVRNVLVHTGSRITPEFLRRAGSAGEHLRIGETITVDFDFLDRVANSILIAGSDLFRVVATKFFAVSHKDLDRVWRRTREPVQGKERQELPGGI